MRDIVQGFIVEFVAELGVRLRNICDAVVPQEKSGLGYPYTIQEGCPERSPHPGP
jgi:hypothetical protein